MPCAAGSYQDEQACLQCPAGKYSGAVSSSSCVDCAAGKYVATQGNDEEADCVLCPAGKYSSSLGATEPAACTECGPGKYLLSQGNDAQEDCILCEAGKYSARVGATEAATCVDCAAGKFLATRGSGEEADCTKGSCPPNSILPAGSSNQSECRCNAGYRYVAPANASASGRGRCAEERLESGAWQGCASCMSVRVVLLLPLSIADFDQDEQMRFREAVAAASQAPPAYVTILKIEAASSARRRRHLLAEAVRVHVEIAAPNDNAARELQDSFPLDALNSQLVSRGLPPAKLSGAEGDSLALGPQGEGAVLNSTSEPGWMEALGSWEGIPVMMFVIAAGALLLLLSLVVSIFVCAQRRSRSRGGKCRCCFRASTCCSACPCLGGSRSCCRRKHSGDSSRMATPSARAALDEGLPAPDPEIAQQTQGGAAGSDGSQDAVWCLLCQVVALLWPACPVLLSGVSLGRHGCVARGVVATRGHGVMVTLPRAHCSDALSRRRRAPGAGVPRIARISSSLHRHTPPLRFHLPRVQRRSQDPGQIQVERQAWQARQGRKREGASEQFAATQERHAHGGAGDDGRASGSIASGSASAVGRWT